MLANISNEMPFQTEVNILTERLKHENKINDFIMKGNFFICFSTITAGILGIAVSVINNEMQYSEDIGWLGGSFTFAGIAALFISKNKLFTNINKVNKIQEQLEIFKSCRQKFNHEKYNKICNKFNAPLHQMLEEQRIYDYLKLCLDIKVSETKESKIALKSQKRQLLQGDQRV